MQPNKVSIIITTHRQQQQISQTIESVFAQTFGNFEIVIVDDGANDKTPRHLSPYLDKITYIRQPYQGITAARTEGLKIAQGKLILFMQADDYLPPKKLEWQIRRLQSQPELGLVYFGEQIPNWEGIYWEPAQIIRILEKDFPNDDPDNCFAMEMFLIGWPLIRRECLEQARFLDISQIIQDQWNPWQKIIDSGYQIDSSDQLSLLTGHREISLRKFNGKDINAARRYMAETLRLFPAILSDPKTFANAILEYSKKPEIDDAVGFAEKVFNNVPEAANNLQKFRSYVLGELSMVTAFQNYVAGDGSGVRQNIISGLMHKPSFISNKGVVSVFIKSFFNDNLPSQLAGHDIEQLRITIRKVGEWLGRPIDSIKSTVLGTNRSTYIIKSRNDWFMLRLIKPQHSDLDLQHRMAITQLVQRKGIPVPAIIKVYQPSSEITEPAWILEEWVPGVPFVPQSMKWPHAVCVAKELGHYLRQLHQIETLGFGLVSSAALEANYQTFDKWLTACILDKCRLLTGLPGEAITRVESAVQYLTDSYQDTPKLCHFDIHSWNLIVGKQNKLSAIVDWDGVHGSDPAFDIANLHFWLDDDHILTALLRTYAPADAEAFRQRVMAAVICYSIYFARQDDNLNIYPRCLRWLTGDSKQITW